MCKRFNLDYNYDFLHLAELKLTSGLKLPANTMCEFFIHEEGIYIYIYIIVPNKTIKIDRRQVTSAYTISEEEIIEKSKSVIGRAALGGVLFGGLGETVGAISGTGKTSEKSTKVYLVVTYNLGSEEDSVVVFSPKDDSLTEYSSMNKCDKIINKNFFEKSEQDRERKKYC